MKKFRRRVSALLAAGAIALATPFATAAKDKALPASAAELTDAHIVAAMQRGIDFLLSIQNKDGDLKGTWEKGPLSENHPHIGGYTSLALYALLHAADSLQDNPEYRTKLNWRGPALKPAIDYLCQFEPDSTYVAGLQASALGMLPRIPDEKYGEGIRGGLERCRMYILGSMGPEGGYTYEGRKPGEFQKLWDAYFKEVARNNRKGTARDALDKHVDSIYDTFGGPMLELQKLMTDLREKQKTAKDSREKTLLAAEIKEVERYAAEIKDPEIEKIAMWKKRIAASEAAKRKAKSKDEIAKLDKDIAADKGYLAHAMFNAKGDNSNNQYGVLGAWAIADWGIELPNAYWIAVDKFYRHQQNQRGDWGYYNPDGPNSEDKERPALGAAGVATLFVCQEFLDNELRLIPKPDKNIERGLAYLNKQFDGSGDGYYMYSLERVGLASGLKFFGAKNWYKEGAFHLIENQKTQGLISTSYALLFWSRGRNPVCFNKLEYKGPWNARPMDSAYATRWMSKRFEKPINWQVVNLQVKPEEWLDAPILLITGSQDPKFTKDDIEKLRTFINAGGMIYSTADGASASFTNAIKKYAAEVVNKKYEMRQLPRNHHLFSKDLGVNLPNPPPVVGMSNGIRELWIHSADDVGADWQMRKFSSRNFELGAALYFYASGMGSLRTKLQPLAVDDSKAAPTQSLNVALIDYAGNPVPEPGAWDRMAKLARVNFNTSVKPALTKFADLDAKKTPLAHLTGAAKVVFTPEESSALKTYLDNGGMLFVDAAAGNADFVAAARDLIKTASPDAPLAPMPPDHPVLAGSVPGGAPLDQVDFRKFGELTLKKKVRSVSLEQVAVNGKTRVIFSEYDIASGFLGTNTWGILGYAPSTAQTLGRNILLHALNPAPVNAKASTDPAK